MSKIITFAIPCYNSAAYMDHCIQSILDGADGATDIQIVIVDDGSQKDDTPAKYRRAYQNRHATFSFDAQEFELRLEGQKRYARSKYKDVYGLCDTDRCFYLIIKGRAHYILPKAAVEGGSAEEFRQFIEKQCGRKFQHYDLNAEPEK